MGLLQHAERRPPSESDPRLAVDSYLTDGVKLLRIAHTLPCSVEGELFLALEDCATLEIVLCPARALGESGLRPVTPAAAA
jgi:hypothetical protein